MIRPKLRYSDSRRKGLFYSALEPKLFSKLLFRDDGDPYFPRATVTRRRLDWAEDHWCALGSRANSRRALPMERPWPTRRWSPSSFASCFSARTATLTSLAPPPRRRRLDWAEDHWCASGSRANSRRALPMETAEAHSWRQYAASPAMRSRKLGNGFFLWVRATPLFLCRLHARRHRS